LQKYLFELFIFSIFEGKINLKKYFIQYKPFLLFLGKFLLTYFVLTFVYESYLNQFDAKNFEVDGFTKMVANQTIDCLSFFGSDSYQMVNISSQSVKIFYNQVYIAQIIEGCNALSVIILFVSFIIAFTGKLKTTILYIVGGSLLIHILNVARIAILCVLLYRFPAEEHLLHGVVFPLIIYGVVFLLWVIWVNTFSVYAKKNN
jgi:exosortase family protein XrtF